MTGHPERRATNKNRKGSNMTGKPEDKTGRTQRAGYVPPLEYWSTEQTAPKKPERPKRRIAANSADAPVWLQELVAKGKRNSAPRVKTDMDIRWERLATEVGKDSMRRHEILTLIGHGHEIGLMSDGDRRRFWPAPRRPDFCHWPASGALVEYFSADILAALHWQAERVVICWYGRYGYFIPPAIRPFQKLMPNVEFISTHHSYDFDGLLAQEAKSDALARRTCFIVPAKVKEFLEVLRNAGFVPTTRHLTPFRLTGNLPPCNPPEVAAVRPDVT